MPLAVLPFKHGSRLLSTRATRKATPKVKGELELGPGEMNWSP